MNPFRSLVVATAMSLAAVPGNAQVCENGICRLNSPNRNSSGQTSGDQYSAGRYSTGQNLWNRNLRGQSPVDQNQPFPREFNRPTNYDWRQLTNDNSAMPHRNTSVGGNRYSPVTASCPACGCKGDYCTCGPNCPSHYQSGNRFGNTFSAPRPTTNQYQAASYRPLIPWLSNYETALDQSRRSGRPVLVKVSATWCGACKQMKNETLTNAGVIRDISTAFIPVEIDADIDRKLIEQMGVRSLPSLLVITPDLRIVERIEGFRTPQQLSTTLLRHTQRAQLDTDVKVAGL